MDISVIIVSYNVRYYLRQCLESVWTSARHSGLDVEVFVVDNHSPDHSIGYLRACFPPHRYPTLHLVSNYQNVGFGRANNQALRKAAGRYILFLNPDTIITEDTLHDCFRFAESHPKMGAMGARMLSAKGAFSFESRRGLPTPWVAFCKMTGLCSLFPKNKRLGRYYMRYLDEHEAAKIDIVSGAFMFCSHDALLTTGGFDERFFMYGEDIDLSYRFLLSGYDNWYLPTPILHYKGESTQKGSFKYIHTFYEAMLIFFRKHYHRASIILSFPIKTAIIAQACIALIKQQAKEFLNYLSPSQDKEPTEICYYGPAQTHPVISSKCEEWNVRIACMDDLEQPAPPTATVVAYDAEHYSFREILASLEKKHLSLATYYPSRHALILYNRIYH